MSRALRAATVEGGYDDVVTPRVLGMIGRDLVRVGESLHVIRMNAGGLRLVPASTWYWEGNADPATWRCTATCYGPSGSTTWRVPFSGVVFTTWGEPTARPYHGLGPGAWASESARLHLNAERGLANEAGGPAALMLPVPDGQDTESDDDSDPNAKLRADIKAAKGRALLLETTASGYGEGRASAPLRDWQQSRLGPAPPESLVSLADSASNRMLAAAGVPPSLFVDSDGTSQREAVRRWHMNVCVPVTRMLEAELRDKLDAPDLAIAHDSYALDLVSRAQVVDKLVKAGVPIATAMMAVNLEADA